MYGSSFIIVTRRPRASRMAASDAEAMPLPKEDTTPPVTKIRGVMTQHNSDAGKAIVYRLGAIPASFRASAGSKGPEKTLQFREPAHR